MKWKNEETKFFSKVLVFIMIFQLFTPFLEVSTVSAKSEKNTIIDKLEIVGGVPEEGYWPGDVINLEGDFSFPDDSLEYVYDHNYGFTVKIPEGFTPVGNTIILGDMGQGEINKEKNTIEFTFNENINHKIDRKGGFNLFLRVDKPKANSSESVKNIPFKLKEDKKELEIENLKGEKVSVNIGKRPSVPDNLGPIRKTVTSLSKSMSSKNFDPSIVKWHIDINPYTDKTLKTKEGVLKDRFVGDNHEILRREKINEDDIKEDITFTVDVSKPYIKPNIKVDPTEEEEKEIKKIEEYIKSNITIDDDLKGFEVKLKGLDKYRILITYKTQYTGNPVLDMMSDDYKNGILKLHNEAKLIPHDKENENIKELAASGEVILGGWSRGEDLKELKINKVDSTNSEKKLSDAEFELYRMENFLLEKEKEPIIIKEIDDSSGEYGIDDKEMIIEKSVIAGDSKDTIKSTILKDGKIAPGEYVLIETKAPKGYKLDRNPKIIEIKDDGNEFVYEVENTPSVDITVNKKWENFKGENLKEELREDVVISVFKNEDQNLVRRGVLQKGEGSSIEFKNLPAYDEKGKLIKYIVKEETKLDNFEESKPVKNEENTEVSDGGHEYYQEYTVINKMKEPNLDINLEKVDFYNNSKKLEGSVFELKKVKDEYGNEISEILSSELNLDKGQKTIKGLKVGEYELKEIKAPKDYRVLEKPVIFEIDDYGEVKIVGNEEHGLITDENGKVSIKVKNVPEKRDLTVEKVWDGKPQDNASFDLYGNKELVEANVVLNEKNNWKHTFKELDTVDKNGEPINYHVEEVEVPDNYKVSYKETSDGIAIINSFIPEKTEVSVRKLWEGRKLDKVRVQLLANREVVDIVTLSDSNNWQYTFTNIDKTDKFENPINYSVREMDVPEGYSVSYSGKDNDFTITNTKTMPIPPIEKIDLEVEKKWDGKVLDQVEVELLADGSVVDRVELSEFNDWAYKFEDLDATDIDGTEIEYEVRETNVPEGYRVDYKRIDNKFIITNTEEKLNEKIDIKVIKKWLDSNGRDLTKAYKAAKIQDNVLELPSTSNDNNLKEELPIKEEKIEEIKKDEFEEDIENNEEIKLETEELEEELIDEVPEEIKIEEDIENRDEPKVDKISYTTIKDNASEDEFRNLEKSLDKEEVEEVILPESIEVTLKANGKALKTVRVKESDNWEYIFKNLDKYDENGNEIKYTISETPVEGFKTSYSKDGFTIINTKIDEGTDPVEPTDPEDNGNSEHEDGENKPHYPTPEDNEKDPGTTNGENKPGNTTKPNKPNDMGSLDNSKKPQKVDKPNQSINKGSLPATGSKSQIGTYILGVSMILLGIALRRKNK